jgi:predicted DNA binding CopG/RHH family protein
MSNLKRIPDFNSPEEEALFWDTHDSAEYVDWSQAKKTVFPNLKASTESISLRLPSPLLARIKELANEKDVPYQSLMKVYLSDQVKRELKAAVHQKP